MRVFGCRAYGKKPDSLRTKLQDQAERYIFVGYTGTDRNYRLWEEGTTQVFVFRHVVFNEAVFPAEEQHPADLDPLFDPPPAKRPRGRPKGSKNKAKVTGVDADSHQLPPILADEEGDFHQFPLIPSADGDDGDHPADQEEVVAHDVEDSAHALCRGDH